MTILLDGKVALVTGAGRGIGRATALELARRGAMVLATARSLDPHDQLEAQLRALSPDSAALLCDVRRYEDLTAAVAAAGGRVDILVNNAAVIAPIAAIADVDPSEWADALAVNLAGCLSACRAVLPGMLAAGGGAIVNVSSGAAGRPLEGWSAYCASKAGLAMLTRSLALEYGARGVRAYGLRPGVVDTNMQALIRASGVNEVSRLRREELADPARPARAIAWLCTPAAEHLAGQEVDIRDLVEHL